MKKRTDSGRLLTALFACALLGTGAVADEPMEPGDPMAADEAASELPDPEAWEDGPDRETLVRFARAWGMVTGTLREEEPETDPLDESLRDPAELSGTLSREVRSQLRQNGLNPDEWASLLARMDRDPDFRNRVEMLALPYQTPTN